MCRSFIHYTISFSLTRPVNRVRFCAVLLCNWLAMAVEVAWERLQTYPGRLRG